MQGLDLLAPSSSKRLAARREFYYEHPFRHAAIPQVTGVRGERYKLARYEQQGNVVEQLFDLEKDPHEEHDLAASPQHQEQLQALRARLAPWQKDVD